MKNTNIPPVRGSIGERTRSSFSGLIILLCLLLGGAVRAQDVLNVTQSSSHSTIQAAIDAAGAGDVISVPAGGIAESVNLNKAVTLRGAKHGVAAGSNPGDRGTGETILDGGIFASAPGAVIDGFTIRNGRVSGSFKVGVGVTASNVTVTNTVIENVLLPAQSDGLTTTTGVNNLTVTNSTIRNNWRGVYLNPGSGHVFTNNLIDGNNGVGVGIGSDGQSNLTLTGNTISNHILEGWGASGVGANVIASENSFINNEVSVAHHGGNAIDANYNYWGSAAGPAGEISLNVTALTYYTDVDLNNLDAPVFNLTKGTGHPTIQAAIDAAQPDDTIQIDAGTHVTNGALIVSKKLHFKGAGMDQTIIKRAGAPTGTEDYAVHINYSPTHNGAIPAAGGIPLTSGSSFEDLTLAGWETAGNGSGYLMWAGGIHDLHLNEVAFRSNDNRCALFHDLGDDSIIENCEFTGSYRRWAYRGAGRRITFRDNTFDVQNSENGGVMCLEYGRGTSGSIKDNVFKHTLSGSGFATGAGSHRTLWIRNPLNPGSPGAPEDLRIEGNTFEFVGAGVPNGSAAYAVPTAIHNQRDGYSLNVSPGAPTFITGNTFVGYDYHGSAVSNPHVVATHFNSTVARNVFSARSKSVALLTGTGATPLDATYNYWGGEFGPAPGDAIGNATTAPYFKNETLSVAGPVHVMGASSDVGHLTIQGGVNAAAAGETVKVDPGTYAENVVTTVPLTIQGSGPGTVIKPTAGVGVTLAAGVDGTNRTVLRSLNIEGNGSATGIVAGSHTTVEDVTSSGHASYGISLNQGTDLDIADSHFDGNNVGMKIGSAVSFTEIEITGSTFDNNSQGWYSDANQSTAPILQGVVIENTSFSGNGIKGFYTERLSDAVFDNVTVADNANSSGYNFGAGIDINLKWRSDYASIEIKDSTFTNNGNGSLNGAALTIKARNDGSYSSPAAALDGVVVTGSVFANNERHYVGGEPGKNNAGPTDVVISHSKFGPSTNAAVVNHTSSAITATHNYWGAVNPGFAALVTGPVVYSPWYADLPMTQLVDESNFEDLTIAPGQTVTVPNLYIGGGSTWTIRGRLVVEGPFALEDGSTLEVLDGDVVFEDGTEMSGTFTFFNSFGSVNFNDDVTITGSAEGLILVSDVHVADGAVITVQGPGSFTIDGCTVDSNGTFDLVVESGAEFTMARTAFSKGHIEVESGLVKIYDNSFSNATVNVASWVAGAQVYHNLVTDLANITDSGTGTVQTVDGWGNVIDPSLTDNNLPLGWELSPAAVTGKRTIDANGVAYVQPGDSLEATVSVSDLQGGIVGVELLMGYNTDYFTASGTLGLSSNWDAVVTKTDTGNVIGKFDTALGLDFTLPASGTTVNQTVGDLALTVKPSVEGISQVFHRVKLDSDTFGGETRLTKGLPASGYYTPFTSNTPEVIIDDTDPVLDTDGGDADSIPDHTTFTQGAADLTQVVALQGVIDFNTVAFDALAGIDDVDAVLTLVGPATYATTQVSTGVGPVIGADTYTAYGFQYEVTAATLNGVYNVVFTVTDRSGNESSSVLGTIEVNKFEITATLELEGLETGAVTRDVTFVFTNAANAVLDTRTRTVNFTNRVGSVEFTDVPVATANLSAKATTHLREKVGVTFDGNGQASVAYTGAPGGDLNGDNVVNLLDYAVLKFYWLKQVSIDPLAAAAEITGDGSVNLTDYQILQGNFYKQGDPQ